MFFTASSGAVTGSRYMSSVTITQINSIGISSDYLVAATQSPNSVLIYSFSSGSFTIFASDVILTGAGYDPSSGR